MMKGEVMTTMSNRYQADAGKNRPTMRHVAALAGVGIKTVSRVMNDEPGVSDATRQRVLGASKQLNYQLDMAAGSLRRT
jgi:LacI family transcriptional regulator